MGLKIETVLCGAYEENAYIVSMEGREDCVVIDPGDDVPALEKATEGRRVEAILLTHGHFDHILGAYALREKTGAHVYISAADMPMLSDVKLNLYNASVSREPFRPVEDAKAYGETLEICGMKLDICPTPGHTPGSVCLYEKSQGVIFTGDTLFMGGYGRTDFPGGSFAQLRQSLRFLLFLPGETVFYAGHGQHGRIGENR